MKNNNIPPFLLCPTPDLARQVLEKIERESDLMWEESGDYPTSYIIPNTYYPNTVIAVRSTGLEYSSKDFYKESCQITNFTKAEDYLNNNYMTEKTWENLQEGWVLEHSRDEFEILAIRGRVIDLSSSNDFNLAGGRYTKEELINGGFKIKGASEDKPSINQIINFLQVYRESVLENKPSPIDTAIEMLKKLK